MLLKCLIWACLLMSSEKRRTQNVLRIFLDPLLDALEKFGTNAYMPLLKTDRCLQLLLKLLHTCLSKGSGTQDGEDQQFMLVFGHVYHWYSGYIVGTQNEKKFLTFIFSLIHSANICCVVLGRQRRRSRLPIRS